MIAELFYPKELKEIIADLRAEDDLNEEALKRLDKIIYQGIRSGIILCVFLSLFLLHDEIREFFVFPAIVMFLLIFLFIALDLRKLFQKIIPLYNFGHYVSGACVVYADGGSLYNPYGFFLKVQAPIEGSAILSVLRAKNFTRDRYSYKKGDEVLVAYDPSNPDHHVPIIKSYAEIFYLRRTPINERLKSMNSMHDV